MRFFDAAEIRRLLDFPTLIDALAEGHAAERIQVQDGFLGVPSAQYFVRHAVAPGRFMASKLITSFPGNPGQGALPAVQAVLVLFDGQDGRPLAVMDGTEITYWRTAADSALGARYLAPAQPRRLLVVGAGEMAPWLVRSHRTVRPSLEQIRIWNRTPARAQALAARLRAEGLEAEAAPELEPAVRAADVVTCCTRARAPLVLGEWLHPGQHLDLVGGFTAETREADDVAAARALVFTDLRESAFHGVGDILGPIAAGAMTAADVLADHYDLASGSVPGRRTAGDITLFKNAGGGHLDLMTAALVYRLASV